MSFALRDYQTATLDVLRGEFAAGKKRVMLYAPTGAGKTEMGIEMIRGAAAKGRRTLFVANRIDLVGQTSRRFRQSELDHGILQSGNTFGTWKDVVVASIQTLARRGFPDADFVVIDEAHGCAGSKAYRDMLAAYAGKPVIGLSATPFSRGLGKVYPFGALFESIAAATTIRELVELGFLVDCDIYAPSEPDLSGVKIVAGDYHEKQLGEAVDKPVLVGDIVTHWLRLAKDTQTVCFATNIAHSKHIVEQFKAVGVPAEHLDCYTDERERQAILERVASGETRVISNVAILAEGWDAPRVETMICARPTRSLIRWIQMAGRILRPFPGKERALLLDHSGSAKLLGYPTDDLPLVLDDGKPKKESKTRSAEEPLPKACPSCKYLKPAKVHTCPRCGFAPEKRTDVTTQEGTLTKLKRVKPKITTAEKERIYAELCGYADAHGYRKGWSYHKLKEYCGTYPSRNVEPRTPSEETLRWIRHTQIRYAKHKEKEQRNAA